MTKSVIVRADRQPCRAPPPRMKAMLLGGHPTHKLRVADCGQLPLYFCLRCGCHVQTRPRGLLGVCTGPSPLGNWNIRQIALCKHPCTGEVLGPPSKIHLGGVGLGGPPHRSVMATPPLQSPQALVLPVTTVGSPTLRPRPSPQDGRARALDDVPICIRDRLRTKVALHVARPGPFNRACAGPPRCYAGFDDDEASFCEEDDEEPPREPEDGPWQVPADGLEPLWDHGESTPL